MAKKTKILYIITGLNTGGVEMMLLRSIEAMSDRVENVVVSLSDGGTLGVKMEAAGAKVYTLEMKKNPFGVLRLYRIIRNEKPDVIQCKMYHANLVGGVFSTLAGYKNVFWGIHHTYLDGAKFTTILTNKISALLSRVCCKKVVCCGNIARDVCISYGYPRSKLEIIPNGYDTSFMRPDPEARKKIRRELSIPDECIAIGHIGRYHKIKNHRGLIRAFTAFHKDNPDSRLYMIGDGVAENAEISALIKELGIADAAIAIGRRSDIKDVINAMDFTVLFSFGEAFPNVLAESMLCGKIAISSDAGDARLSLVIPIHSSCWRHKRTRRKDA